MDSETTEALLSMLQAHVLRRMREFASMLRAPRGLRRMQDFQQKQLRAQASKAALYTMDDIVGKSKRGRCNKHTENSDTPAAERAVIRRLGHPWHGGRRSRRQWLCPLPTVDGLGGAALEDRAASSNKIALLFESLPQRVIPSLLQGSRAAFRKRHG